MDTKLIVEEVFLDEDEEKRKQRINEILLSLIRKSIEIEKF